MPSDNRPEVLPRQQQDALFRGRHNSFQIVDEICWPMLQQLMPGGLDPRLAYDKGMDPTICVSILKSLTDPVTGYREAAKIGAEVGAITDSDDWIVFGGELYVVYETKPHELMGALAVDAAFVDVFRDKYKNVGEADIPMIDDDKYDMGKAAQELLEKINDEEVDPEEVIRYSGVQYEFDKDGEVNEYYVRELVCDDYDNYIKEPGRTNITHFDYYDLARLLTIAKGLGLKQKKIEVFKKIMNNPEIF